MKLTLTETARAQLVAALLLQRCDELRYVRVAVLLLDGGRSVASIAEDLGLDAGAVCRYAQVYRLHELAKYLSADQARYWELLTSAQLAYPLLGSALHALPGR